MTYCRTVVCLNCCLINCSFLASLLRLLIWLGVLPQLSPSQPFPAAHDSTPTSFGYLFNAFPCYLIPAYVSSKVMQNFGLVTAEVATVVTRGSSAPGP